MLKCGGCERHRMGDHRAEGYPHIAGHEPSYCDHPATGEFHKVDADDRCIHGYPDIWAAKGAARLIEMAEPPYILTSGAYVYVAQDKGGKVTVQKLSEP